MRNLPAIAGDMVRPLGPFGRAAPVGRDAKRDADTRGADRPDDPHIAGRAIDAPLAREAGAEIGDLDAVAPVVHMRGDEDGGVA